jgi:hypothetical protein
MRELYSTAELVISSLDSGNSLDREDIVLAMKALVVIADETKELDISSSFKISWLRQHSFPQKLRPY